MSIETSAENREMSHSTSDHHVKFNIQEEEFKNHHENLEISTISPNNFHVNLGYLKVEHNYKITFSLHLNGSISCDNLKYLAERSSKHVTFKECKREANSNLYTFTVLFYAYREKHDQETVYLSSAESGSHSANQVVIHFEAKVLGVHQGTPLLRNGITLLHTHSNNPVHASASEKSHFNIN